MKPQQHDNTSGRSSKFVKDMGIYAIGNIGSKLITFMMVPLYTYFVHDTGDFGYYDVCLTACFLLMPFVTLQLRDGAFRFLIDSNDDTMRDRVVTLTVRTLGVNVMLMVAMALVVALVRPIDYLWHIVALLFAMSLQDVLSQVMRGLGHNKAFVTVGILSALGIGVFSIVFVAWLGMGIAGIFLANIVARLLALALVEWRTGLLRRHFNTHIKVSDMAREVLRYCIPLLPGSLCWWLTGSSDRWFIMHYLGLDVNGVYAVAIRFTAILQTLATIFYQAWQETALLQYNSPDRDRFFSKMLNGYIYILAIVALGYNFMLKINYGWLVAKEYQASVAYLYPLAVSAVIFAVAAFFDMGYQCAKDTARTLPAIMLSAVVNVVLNIVLTPLWGVWGVIATIVVTYTILVIYRWHDMKRYLRLTLMPRTMVPVLAVAAGAIPFYLSPHMWVDLIAMVALIVVVAVAMPHDMRNDLLAPIMRRLRR